MKKVLFTIFVVLTVAAVAVAQYTPPPATTTPIGTTTPTTPTYGTGSGAVVGTSLPPDYAGVTQDILGAHLVYGRGCVACHAPHSGPAGNGQGGSLSIGNQGLWGANWGTLPGTTLAFGDQGNFPVTLPSGTWGAFEVNPAPTGGGNAYIFGARTGIMLCLSCHDGVAATNSMMTGNTFETLPVAGGTAPSLLNKDSSGYNNDHPVGPSATVGPGAAADCSGGLAAYGWDGCTLTFGGEYGTTPEITPTGAAFLQFVNVNYGYTIELSKSGTGAMVTCTSCHDQHSMRVYVGTIAGNYGAYKTAFFVRGYYNPVNGSNSVAQFCRQCHGGESNEMHGQFNVPTI